MATMAWLIGVLNRSAQLYYIYFLQRQRLRNDSDSLLKDSIKRVDQRLLVIPLVFVLLRIWGTIQFFFTLTISYYWDSGCVSKSIYYVHYSLGIMEVS